MRGKLDGIAECFVHSKNAAAMNSGKARAINCNGVGVGIARDGINYCGAGAHLAIVTADDAARSYFRFPGGDICGNSRIAMIGVNEDKIETPVSHEPSGVATATNKNVKLCGPRLRVVQKSAEYIILRRDLSVSRNAWTACPCINAQQSGAGYTGNLRQQHLRASVTEPASYFRDAAAWPQCMCRKVCEHLCIGG